jgi:hypothetical protein
MLYSLIYAKSKRGGYDASQEIKGQYAEHKVVRIKVVFRDIPVQRLKHVYKLRKIAFKK